jgi:hypothetical protein
MQHHYNEFLLNSSKKRFEKKDLDDFLAFLRKYREDIDCLLKDVGELRNTYKLLDGEVEQPNRTEMKVKEYPYCFVKFDF